jgi:hypothetical protein
VAMLIFFGAVGIGWVSVYIGIILAFGISNSGLLLMSIIDDYNKEIDSQK